MRWVFFGLLIVNVLYLVGELVLGVAPGVIPRTTAPTPAGGASLVLLAESDDSRSQAPDQGRDVRLDKCLMAGPWAEREAAQQALSQVPAEWRGTVRALDVVRDRLHWVFLPPAEDREEALRVLRELQNRQVDSFLVGEGEDRNAISLGYFSRADSARGLMVKMRSEGYPAEVRETSRTLREFWLRFPVDENLAFSEDVSQRLQSAGASEVRQAACD